jgi:PAS domain S-box-containing protein
VGTDTRTARELSGDALAEAQRIAHLGVWEWDVASGEVSWSDELFRIYGVAPSEYRPSYEGYMSRVHPEDRDDVAATIAQALVDARPFEFRERIVRPDGSVRVLRSGGRVALGDDGRPARMVGVCHDVTERSEAEAALATARAEVERRRFAERQAAQINDGIIESLVQAMQALDAGDTRRVGDAMRLTLERASRIVTELQTPGGRDS